MEEESSRDFLVHQEKDHHKKKVVYPRIDPSESLDWSSSNDLDFLLHLIIFYQAN